MRRCRNATGVKYYSDTDIAATIPANAAVNTSIAKSASFSPIQCLFGTGRRLVGTVWNETKTITITAKRKIAHVFDLIENCRQLF